MATNEILKFAENSTNVLSQAAYDADAQRLIGHQPGIARSPLANKAMLQASLMASGIAQYLADNQAVNITDALTPANIATYFGDAIGANFATNLAVQQAAMNSAVGGGTANAITASFTPAITALTNGMTLFVRAAAATTSTTPTFTPNSGTIAAKTIVKYNNQALESGDVAGAGHWLELQYDSVQDKWVLQNPKVSAEEPAMVLLSTATASNDATIDFTGIDSTYTNYKLIYSLVRPASDGVAFRFRVGTGGVPTYDTGANYREARHGYNGVDGIRTSSGQSLNQITVTGFSGAGTGTGETISGELLIASPSSSDVTDFNNRMSYTTSDNSIDVISVAGQYKQTTPVTAIRAFMSAGNIASGEFKLYGVK